MTFVLTRLNEPSDIVDVHFLPLVDSTAHYLVVARRRSIELYWLEEDHSLSLRRSIAVLDTVLDVQPITPLELPGTWLAVTTESNKVLLVAFRGNISREVVVEEYDLKEMGHLLSIEPRTLCTEAGRFFSLYTTEGSALIFTMARGKDLKNFAKALDPKSKGKQLLFKPPQVYTLTDMQGRTPLVIEAISSHYEENVQDATLSVLYRDDLYNFYSSYFAVDKNQMEQNHKLRLPEEMSPVILPLRTNLGTVLFGKTGIYLRAYPDMIENLKPGPELTSSKDGQSVEVIQPGEKLHFIKKTIPKKTWTITAAHIIDTRTFGNTTSIIFSTSEEYMYITDIGTEVLQDNFGYPEFLSVNSWKLRRFPSKLLAAEKITQITPTVFITHSNTRGIVTFEIDSKALSFTILNKSSVTPPILDFNITGSDVPKVQILGGSSTSEGLIRTEFKGYETDSTEIGKIKTPEGVTGIWKFANTYLINHLDGVQIFQDTDAGVVEIDDFHGLTAVNGGVIDVHFSSDQMICITETGVYQENQKIMSGHITAGCITDSGTPVIVNNGVLEVKSQRYKLSEEVSSIHALEIGRSVHVLVGTWSGEASLFVDGSKKVLRKSDLPIHSVLIKRIGSTTLYLVGGADGSVSFISGNHATEFSIGSAPVALLNFAGSSVIVGNKENVLRMVLSSNGEVMEKGYLDIEFPQAMSYVSGKSKICTFSRGHICLVDASSVCEILQNEMPLNRLARKSTKFKNFLNLSLMVTITEKYNDSVGRDMMISQLEVIDNNTFKTKSIYKFDEGIEVTDVVNTTYRKDIIDSYEEEKINMGFENILSQCFVVSCVYHMQDESGPPLMLFSIDEDGIIQHQCSTQPSNMSFYSLTNHANRLVVGAGNKICAYQILYSIADSKFSLKKISDSYETRYYSSSIKSVGPDVVVGDIIKSPVRLRLKVKDQIEEGGTVFKFRQDSSDLDFLSFVTAMESYENLVLATDSKKNVQVSLLTSDATTAVSQFNLGDQINAIKTIDRNGKLLLQKDAIATLLVDGKSTGDLPSIVPMFLLGSVGGGLYLISMATSQDVVDILEAAQEAAIRSNLKVLSKKQTADDRVEQYVALRNWRGTRRSMKPMLNFIDGDLIRNHDDDIGKDLIEEHCKLL